MLTIKTIICLLLNHFAQKNVKFCIIFKPRAFFSLNLEYEYRPAPIVGKSKRLADHIWKIPEVNRTFFSWFRFKKSKISDRLVL